MKKIIKWISCALVLVLSFALLACTPANLEKAEEKMDKAGYDVSVLADDDSDAGTVFATKGNEKIMAKFFIDEEAAEEFYNNDVKMLAFVAYDIDSAVLDGKWIYAGSAKAIEDFKK